jgi:hypothetical protein
MSFDARRKSTRGNDRARSLNLELLEDRRVLTTMADVVFLADESGSSGDTIKNWLSANIDQFDATLRSSDIDVRYGLVGYGQIPRFAHSHLVDTNTSKTSFERLWSEGDNLADIKAAIPTLDTFGANGEDGWDAIDHAIAEYDFRPGAVPVFVLVQFGEGRETDNGGANARGRIGRTQE